MVLGFDITRMLGHRTGVGRYLEHLLGSWTCLDLPFDELVLYSPLPVGDIPPDPRFRPTVLPWRGSRLLWQTIRLRPRAQRNGLFLSPYTLPIGYRGRSVVLNLGILEGPWADTMPGLRSRARGRHIAASARHASLLIANSPTTKGDIVRFYGVAPTRVRIVRPGVRDSFRYDDAVTPAAKNDVADQLIDPSTRVLLFVGKLSVRRHVPALIEGFAKVARSRPELRLLLAGPNTGNVPVDELVERHGVQGLVRYVEFVDEETLAALYHRARGLVMLSEREGFSHPTLEAMSGGCPVIVLRDRALGVLDYAEERDGLVLEAHDALPASIGDALARLADDDALHAALRERGIAFATEFPTWSEHAAATMEILAEVAG